ncbi:hypothetical protein CO652_15015 [Rhizobium sp. H4]|nr:hypothetical protein CO652_15015 [Rhizobium sp. H4]
MVVISIEPVLKLFFCQIFMFCATYPGLYVKIDAFRLLSAISEFQLDRRWIKQDDQSPNRFDMMSSRKTGRRNL